MPFKDVEDKRKYNKIYWKKNKFKYRKNVVMTRIGTSDFSEHMESNFDDEAEEVKKELIRLGLAHRI